MLPPIEEPERYVSRLQWDKNGEIELADVEQIKKNTVIIVQTDTEECDSTKTCSRLLNLMQVNTEIKV